MRHRGLHTACTLWLLAAVSGLGASCSSRRTPAESRPAPSAQGTSGRTAMGRPEPSAMSGTAPRRQRPQAIRPIAHAALLVEIEPSGAYRVGAQVLSPAALLARLRALGPKERAQGVMLHLLPGAPKARVVALFDLLGKAGIRRFGARRVVMAHAKRPASPR